MSASVNWVFWNSAIGWPNCWRSLVYRSASSRQRCAPPSEQAPMLMPPAVEPGHGDAEAVALAADEVLRRHADIVEDQRRGRLRMPAELALGRAEADAGHVLLDREARDALGPGLAGADHRQVELVRPAPLMNCLVPLTTQSSPSRTAVA
jgi:hypothetical protein